MSHGRLLILVILALSACSKNTAPSAPAASSTTDTAAATTAPAQTNSPNGSTLLATEPDGVHIEYRVAGKGDPAIVLIHGWATDANYWNAQIAPLQAKYTVVTVDLAGHGGSTKSRTDWSMEKYGEDVATVVQRIPNQQVILVGHSMGGTVALEAAHTLGNRVIGIIVVDALKSVGLPPLSPLQIQTRVAPFRTDFIGAVRKYVSEELFEKGADPMFVQKVAYDMSLEPPEVGVPSLEALLSMDFRTVLADIKVPVLAINSDLGATDDARIRKALRTFKSDVIPHTSHFLMMEVPDKFNPILLRDIDTIARNSQR
jgi:pimeloyl-ACP methyl ester carboxylesterase